MFSTAEIRWFIKGEVPEEILAWFNGFNEFPLSPQTRTDHYLRLPAKDIGIKIREGLIEHKQCDGVGELWTDGIHAGETGYWQKWSFPLDDDASIPEMLKTYPESWTGITKERQMRIIEADEKGKMTTTSYEKVSGTAVGWELTKLKIEGSKDSWWTMGFESFGDEGELKEALIKVCTSILADSPLALSAENCYSYPEFLKDI